jgi:hypothetical protein
MHRIFSALNGFLFFCHGGDGCELKHFSDSDLNYGDGFQCGDGEGSGYGDGDYFGNSFGGGTQNKSAILSTEEASF